MAALLLASAIGVGLVAARVFALPEPQPVDAADRLRIDVVQPVEPGIIAGDTMDVGTLDNGFRYVPPSRPSVDTTRYEPADEPFYLPESRPQPRRAPEPEPLPPPPEVESRPPRADRWFGFDMPGRDYQAEREARRDRREALERRDYEQDRARGADRAREEAEAEERRRWSDLDYPPDSAP